MVPGGLMKKLLQKHCRATERETTPLSKTSFKASFGLALPVLRVVLAQPPLTPMCVYPYLCLNGSGGPSTSLWSIAVLAKLTLCMVSTF